MFQNRFDFQLYKFCENYQLQMHFVLTFGEVGDDLKLDEEVWLAGK